MRMVNILSIGIFHKKSHRSRLRNNWEEMTPSALRKIIWQNVHKIETFQYDEVATIEELEEYPPELLHSEPSWRAWHRTPNLALLPVKF